MGQLLLSLADTLSAVVPFMADRKDGIGRVCFVRVLRWLMDAGGRHAFDSRSWTALYLAGSGSEEHKDEDIGW